MKESTKLALMNTACSRQKPSNISKAKKANKNQQAHLDRIQLQRVIFCRQVSKLMTRTNSSKSNETSTLTGKLSSKLIQKKMSKALIMNSL
jgi:hypothetical protein